MSYAKVLGATSRQDGYLEGNGYLVSWCVGHLVELAPPNVYDAKYVKWSIADLPILPERWQYLVSASTKKQFGILQKLMHRPDVDSVICATDSGREGELIFRLVYQQAGCKKPFSRLWLSSMEENAIREGFAHLKPSTEYDALYNAALCRERADWMVGINASRLFSCLYGQPLAVGRVMTPVLAMTVVREATIAAFVPEKFYTVDLELTSGCTASSRRIPEKSVAENLLEACRKEMVATIQRITRKEKSENPPPLYDLTTLQRDANRLLGYSAQQTLDYVQSLYTVMSNHHLQDKRLSLKAKGLLSYMLSLPDDWDYSLKGLTVGCKDGLDSVRTAVLELEEHGYVRRQKVRNAKGQIIDYDYQVYESLVEDAPAVPGKEGGPSNPSASKSPKSRMKPCSSPFLDFPNLAEPNLEKATQQNTNKQNTKRQSTNLSGQTDESADFDQMEAQVREEFRERLEIDTLAQRYDPDKLEELLDNIVEMYCCPRQTQYVGKQPQTTKAIRLRLDKLTSQHVEYIFDVMSNTTQPIKNIMAYLRTTILNAPTTMEHYYQAQGNWLTAQSRKK